MAGSNPAISRHHFDCFRCLDAHIRCLGHLDAIRVQGCLEGSRHFGRAVAQASGLVRRRLQYASRLVNNTFLIHKYLFVQEFKTLVVIIKSPAFLTCHPLGELEAKVAEQTQKIAKLRLAVEGLEKERDFYFAKLREIEVLCQSDEAAVPEAAGFKDKVLEILYKTDDEEFAAPAEDTPADQ